MKFSHLAAFAATILGTSWARAADVIIGNTSSSPGLDSWFWFLLSLL